MDISRVLVRSAEVLEAVGERVEVMLCWFDDEAALDSPATDALKHTTRWTRARVEAVRYRLEVPDLRRWCGGSVGIG